MFHLQEEDDEEEKEMTFRLKQASSLAFSSRLHYRHHYPKQISDRKKKTHNKHGNLDIFGLSN